MRIVDEKLLKTFRGAGACGYCGRWCQHREAAHVVARGMGGGRRNDVPVNVVSLGCAFCCGCHASSHAGREPKYERLVEVVAARERLSVDEVKEQLRVILWGYA